MDQLGFPEADRFEPVYAIATDLFFGAQGFFTRRFAVLEDSSCETSNTLVNANTTILLHQNGKTLSMPQLATYSPLRSAIVPNGLKLAHPESQLSAHQARGEQP